MTNVSCWTCRCAAWWQVENEFGFVGPNEPYLRHLNSTARNALGDNVVLYSTDPPSVIDDGTLGGNYVFACALACTFLLLMHAVMSSCGAFLGSTTDSGRQTSMHVGLRNATHVPDMQHCCMTYA